MKPKLGTRSKGTATAQSGTRDAVETAIDLAKEGRAWESGKTKIKPWQPAKEDQTDACEENLVEQR
jgi:hypothetical protein